MPLKYVFTIFKVNFCFAVSRACGLISFAGTWFHFWLLFIRNFDSLQRKGNHDANLGQVDLFLHFWSSRQKISSMLNFPNVIKPEFLWNESSFHSNWDVSELPYNLLNYKQLMVKFCPLYDRENAGMVVIKFIKVFKSLWWWILVLLDILPIVQNCCVDKSC